VRKEKLRTLIELLLSHLSLEYKPGEKIPGSLVSTAQNEPKRKKR
jgi:hypothetical protein